MTNPRLYYILSMPARSITLRAALPAVLILTAISLSAVPKDKEPAPRFNATTAGGEKFTNDSIKGKVVLLEFWTTWCGYCADEAGFVDKIGHDFANKGLILLAIDVGNPRRLLRNISNSTRALAKSFTWKTPISPPCMRQRSIPFMS